MKSKQMVSNENVFSYFWRTKHTLHVKCTFEKGKMDYFQKSCGDLWALCNVFFIDAIELQKMNLLFAMLKGEN